MEKCSSIKPQLATTSTDLLRFYGNNTKKRAHPSNLKNFVCFKVLNFPVHCSALVIYAVTARILKPLLHRFYYGINLPTGIPSNTSVFRNKCWGQELKQAQSYHQVIV